MFRDMLTERRREADYVNGKWFNLLFFEETAKDMLVHPQSRLRRFLARVLTTMAFSKVLAPRNLPYFMAGPLYEDEATYRFVLIPFDRVSYACARWKQESGTGVIVDSVIHIDPDHDVAMVETTDLVNRCYRCRTCKDTYHIAYTRPWVTSNSQKV